MIDPGLPVFFARLGPFTVPDLASRIGVVVERAWEGTTITGVAPLERAGPSDVAFSDGKKFRAVLGATAAGAVLVSAGEARHVPAHAAVLVASAPQEAFARAILAFHPGADRPPSMGFDQPVPPGAVVHPTARVESGVVIEPGAVVGPEVEIGQGTHVHANAVIAAQCRIGRDCVIGPGVVLQFAILGDRVVLHPGVKIGQDGFGYVMRARGHLKMPQIGRVVIQNDVEIGANTTIDRGALADTIIGEGTKIDNLVQIAHNCVIGRHCVIAGQCGLSGSVTLGDFVALGGSVGIADHRSIGAGARIAARSGIMHDVPPGEVWMGAPAKPMKRFMREVATLTKLVERGSSAGGASDKSQGDE